MDLHLFRLSLKAKELRTLFEPTAQDGSPLTREGWLRLYFSAPHTFNHRGAPFYFSPQNDGIDHLRDLIVGWIGRERTVFERTPPEEGFEQTERSQWKAAFIAIDPTDHEDGQKVAIEANPEIGRPSAILQSIIRHMNEVGDGPYTALGYPIVTEGSFWDFAARHGDQITSLTFDVAAPNMFNDAEDFQDELRKLRDQVNVSQFKATLQSDTNLQHRAPHIEQIVNYTERGAGSLSAEAASGAKYSSEANAAIEHVEDIEHHSKNPRKFLRDILSVLGRIF